MGRVRLTGLLGMTGTKNRGSVCRTMWSGVGANISGVQRIMICRLTIGSHWFFYAAIKNWPNYTGIRVMLMRQPLTLKLGYYTVLWHHTL